MRRASKCPAEFRDEAVKLVLESGRPRAEVAASLGLSEDAGELGRCRARAGDPHGLSESEREVLTRLRRENIDLRIVRRSCARRPCIFGPGDDAVSRFRFVADHCHAYGVKRLCGLVEVSRDG